MRLSVLCASRCAFVLGSIAAAAGCSSAPLASAEEVGTANDSLSYDQVSVANSA